MPHSESRRHRAIADIHDHEEPPEATGGSSLSSPAEDAAEEPPHAGRVWRENGVVYFQPAEEGGEAVAVRAVWARPLSGRGGPVSLMLSGKKREAAYFPDLSVLSDESRRVVEEELSRGGIMPVVTRIFSVRPRFGNYYFEVDTDMGRKRFLLNSPENNSVRPGGDAVILRDVSGNCYRIVSTSALDKPSQRELDRAL